jgi:hypothetical protein
MRGPFAPANAIIAPTQTTALRLHWWYTTIADPIGTNEPRFSTLSFHVMCWRIAPTTAISNDPRIATRVQCWHIMTAALTGINHSTLNLFCTLHPSSSRQSTPAAIPHCHSCSPLHRSAACPTGALRLPRKKRTPFLHPPYILHHGAARLFTAALRAGQALRACRARSTLHSCIPHTYLTTALRAGRRFTPFPPSAQVSTALRCSSPTPSKFLIFADFWYFSKSSKMCECVCGCTQGVCGCDQGV